jgi:cation transport ATPase
MAHPDPEPESTPGPDTEPSPAAEAEARSEVGSEAGSDAGSDAGSEAGREAEVEESAEAKQQQTIIRFLWSCSWLTVLTGVFLLSGMLQPYKTYSALSWLGAVVAVLCLVVLIAAYVACARGKFTLRTRLLGPFDLFQLSTVVVAIAVICGLLIPSSNTAALALLLPWALTYWMYGLDRTQTPAT